MDLLIIKKNKGAVVENEIGRIFRQFNILEFKGSGDSLNIDTYFKVIAYACLYKSLGKHVNEIRADEVTVTIIREAYPRELFKQFKDMGVEVKEEYPGIFYLSGIVLFPTQIIVTKMLDETHPSFRVLSRNAKEEDARRLLEESRLVKEPGEIENIGAVVHVSANANKELYDRITEDKDMADAIREIFADDFEKCEKKGEKKGKKEGKKEATLNNIKSIMETMKLTAKQAMDALKIPESERSKYMTLL